MNGYPPLKPLYIDKVLATSFEIIAAYTSYYGHIEKHGRCRCDDQPNAIAHGSHSCDACLRREVQIYKGTRAKEKGFYNKYFTMARELGVFYQPLGRPWLYLNPSLREFYEELEEARDKVIVKTKDVGPLIKLTEAQKQTLTRYMSRYAQVNELFVGGERVHPFKQVKELLLKRPQSIAQLQKGSHTLRFGVNEETEPAFNDYFLRLLKRFKLASLIKISNNIVSLTTGGQALIPDESSLEGREFYERFYLSNQNATREMEAFVERFALPTDEAHVADQPNPTERRGLVTSRVGQGEYRDKLLEKFHHACAVTGVKLPILIASHIKPWAVSSSKERLDPNNGLLLSPTYDALFDKHLISFSDKGELILPEALREQAMRLGVDPHAKIEVNAEMRPYLAHHRARHAFMNSSQPVQVPLL